MVASQRLHSMPTPVLVSSWDLGGFKHVFHILSDSLDRSVLSSYMSMPMRVVLYPLTWDTTLFRVI